METDSKKRGRPDVFTRDYGENAEVQKALMNNFFEGCKRTITNTHYVVEGLRVANDVYGEDGAKEKFCYPSGKFKGACILEQIGRMRLQDGYSANDCADILKTAVLLREDGFKVKSVSQWIRNGRTTGEW